MGVATAVGAQVEVGVSTMPMPGEVECGDSHVVIAHDHWVLVGVIDGLGHGPEAARSAERAVEVVRERPDLPVCDLVEACHHELRRFRGCVATFASIDVASGEMEWVGVGNVEALLVRRGQRLVDAHEQAMLFDGAIGYRMPRIRSHRVGVQPGDLLVMATDGVSAQFLSAAANGNDPQALAERLRETFAWGTDDSLVLVARMLLER